MAISISTVHVTVDDPDAAVSFYRDALGLQVDQQVAREGMRWVTMVSPDQPDVRIVLSQPHAGRSPEDGDVVATLLAKGEFTPLHFRTDDLDRVIEQVAANADAEVVQEPAEQFWGVRDAAVRDPAGNFLRIEQA